VAPVEKGVLLVVEDAAALDFAVMNLYRMGYSSFAGYLGGGLEAWYGEGLPVSRVDLLTCPQLKGMMESGERLFLIDVRRQSEWDEGHIEEAEHIYLGRLPERLGEVPEDMPVVVQCKTGTRSSFAASILLRAGRKRLYNLLGGIDAWRKLNYLLVCG
jgi:hydroxyacylglutathione hydrolase